MNLLEKGSEARARLEMQLGELGVPAKFVDEIIGHHTLVNYNKGSMIFLQGSPADLLFWVFTGLVKVHCPRSDGTPIMVKLGGPGDLIGHVDYIDSRGRRVQVFEVGALTKCSVALFTRDHVIKLLESAAAQIATVRVGLSRGLGYHQPALNARRISLRSARRDQGVTHRARRVARVPSCSRRALGNRCGAALPIRSPPHQAWAVTMPAAARGSACYFFAWTRL